LLQPYRSPVRLDRGIQMPLQSPLTIRGQGEAFEMLPQLHQFSDPPMQTNQAAIRTMLDGQLYLVVGEPADGGKWLIRMWWKPFVTLIWLGGAMIALGGALSLRGRVRRDIWHKRAAPAKESAA
jgi:cytochrome c-type biogenesis protein CcmF